MFCPSKEIISSLTHLADDEILQATDQTEERINDRFSLGNRTTRKLLTGGAVSGEDERLSSAVFSSREASSVSIAAFLKLPLLTIL